MKKGLESSMTRVAPSRIQEMTLPCVACNEQVTNKIMLVIFLAMAAVTTFSLIGYLIFSAEYDDKLYYLCYDSENAPVELFR